jgi:zinc protease
MLSPKQYAASILVIACMLPLTGSAAAKHKKAAPPPGVTVEKIKLPDVETMETESGMKVFMLRDELPRVAVRVSVGFGKLYENSANAGISDLLARTLALGGSKKYPGEALNAAVENMGGRIGIESTWEETAISIRVLDRYAEAAFDIAGDLLKNPNLDARYMADAKSLIKEGIRRKKDSPETLAFEKVREVIFDGNGYGAVATEQTIEAISLIDLYAAWKSSFVAGNMTAGVVSSLDPEAVRALVGEKLRGLEKGGPRAYPADTGKITAAVRAGAKKVYLVTRPIPQATIVVGTVAPGIRDPGTYALGVMNYILGEGSFNSRLMQEIRVKRGLSYAVQSVVKFRRDTGVFMAFAQTKNEQAGIALSLLLENISRMAGENVRAEELHWARQSIINSYIFEFDTSVKALAQYMWVYYNRLEPSFLLSYPERISAVRGDEVRKAAKGLLQPGLVKVVVGDASIKKALSKFGEVVVIEPR